MNALVSYFFDILDILLIEISINCVFHVLIDRQANTANKHSYMGCFKDNSANKDLPYAVQVTSDKFTIENCVLQCSNMGYSYVGLQKFEFLLNKLNKFDIVLNAM